MCHVHLPLNRHPKSLGTHRHQPLVWVQSEASESRMLLYHTAFWSIDKSLTRDFRAPSRMTYSSTNHMRQVLQRKKWIFPQSHRGDDSYFCKYCKGPCVPLQKGIKQCHRPKRHPCGAVLSSKACFHLSERLYSQLEISGEQSPCTYFSTTEPYRKGKA